MSKRSVPWQTKEKKMVMITTEITLLIISRKLKKRESAITTPLFVVRLNGKLPCIILFSDEQIDDLKMLCCSGQSVWGLDETFNLCYMHITMPSYKQLSVTRDTSSEPPLFFGPMYIHDNSDFESYSIFFLHIKTKLSGIDTSKLVIETDDE